jgi:hypothetical protein
MSDSPNTGPFARRPGHAAFRQSVRVVTMLFYKIVMEPSRILIHISRSEHRVLEPPVNQVLSIARDED